MPSDADEAQASPCPAHETSHCQLACVPDGRRGGRCHHHGGMTPKARHEPRSCRVSPSACCLLELHMPSGPALALSEQCCSACSCSVSPPIRSVERCRGDRMCRGRCLWVAHPARDPHDGSCKSGPCPLHLGKRFRHRQPRAIRSLGRREPEAMTGQSSRVPLPS